MQHTSLVSRRQAPEVSELTLLHAICLVVHGVPHGSRYAHGAVLGLRHHGGVRRCRPHHVRHGWCTGGRMRWGPVGRWHHWHVHGGPRLLLRWHLRGHRHWRRMGRQRVHREVSLRWRHLVSLWWNRVLPRRRHGRPWLWYGVTLGGQDCVSLRCHYVLLSLRRYSLLNGMASR